MSLTRANHLGRLWSPRGNINSQYIPSYIRLCDESILGSKACNSISCSWKGVLLYSRCRQWKSLSKYFHRSNEVDKIILVTETFKRSMFEGNMLPNYQKQEGRHGQKAASLQKTHPALMNLKKTTSLTWSSYYSTTSGFWTGTPGHKDGAVIYSTEPRTRSSTSPSCQRPVHPSRRSDDFHWS